MSEGEVLTRRQGPVLWVTFNRPEQRNAMTFEMYDRLGEICHEAAADEEVRCLVLEGAGEKAFVAGTDISLFRSFATAEDALEYEGRMERNIGALAGLQIPVIAALRGACTGGGFAIAAACDLRLGGPSAKFGIPIARTLGNTVSMASLNLLVDLLGVARAKELLFTARLVEAPEALSWGLLNELLPSDAEVAPRAQALAEQIAANAPLTLRSVKEGIRRIMEARHLPGTDAADLITMAYLSEDFKEGMSAFLEKRKPQWRGR